jgi:hypothetical protein
VVAVPVILSTSLDSTTQSSRNGMRAASSKRFRFDGHSA